MPTPAEMHSVTTLPSAAYREADTLQAERRAIFSRSWLMIAHESQLGSVGDLFAANVAGFPLLVVRGEDKIVRAFHNVCRHRAGPLADDGPGKCEGALVCRYHGWRYALDGRLASARDFGPAQGFDPRDFALHQLKCAVWRGFIFVNIDRDAEALEQSLAPLAARTEHLPLERFQFERRSTHTISCNWKTYVENYLEGYHIPLVHPLLNSAVDASKYEVELAPPVIFHRAPPRDGSPVGGLWAWVWPCLGVNVYADGLLMERISPVSVNVTKLDYLYFFPQGTERATIERSIEVSEITTAEDKVICEAVQRNLDAGVYETGRLSPKHETGVAWFQQEWKNRVRDEGSNLP
jgi:choline monooxygenase